LFGTTQNFRRQHRWAGAKIENLTHFPSPLSDQSIAILLSVLSLPIRRCND
jgi:hypothetical protein